jgi:hypothetical protein
LTCHIQQVARILPLLHKLIDPVTALETSKPPQRAVMQLNFDEKQITAQLSSWTHTETSGLGPNVILECDYDL